jgi:hypothetical protein
MYRPVWVLVIEIYLVIGVWYSRFEMISGLWIQ